MSTQRNARHAVARQVSGRRFRLHKHTKTPAQYLTPEKSENNPKAGLSLTDGVALLQTFHSGYKDSMKNPKLHMEFSSDL